jgi:Tol biopolymer transport system component
MLLSLNSGANPVAITPPDIDASRPTWRWSSSLIAFTYNNDTIYTIERDSANCRPFLAHPPSRLPALLHPSWYRDLKSIAAVGMTETDSGRRSVLYKVTPGKDGADQLEALTTFPNVCAGRPTVSPDGKAVAFAGNAGGCNQESNQLWVVNPPGEPGRLEPGEPMSEYQGRSPNWSPDGKWIAFVSTRPAGSPTKATPKAVWVVSAAGGKAYQLTDCDCNAANVEWSPDQRKIALGSMTYGIGIFDVPEQFLPGAGA